MSCLNEHHKTLDSLGRRKCSVPMWGNGSPSGFCDKEAYGFRAPTRYFRNYCSGYEIAEDGKFSGYVPALACPVHGGPETRVFKDGTSWCAVLPDFIDIQQSVCAFGDTPELARAGLASAIAAAEGKL